MTGGESARPRPVEPVLHIDGRQPISAELVAQIVQACDEAETTARIVAHVTGSPQGGWADDLDVALVSRWERALRRLERLATLTIALADGDCGGAALDVLLATDYRVVTTTTRLVVPVDADITWPGMAVYRLANQGAVAGAVRRAVLFGEPIVALDALALQLVDDVVDDLGAAPGNVAAFAGTGRELAIRRGLLLEASTTSFEEALGTHLAACDRVLRQRAAAAQP